MKFSTRHSLAAALAATLILPTAASCRRQEAAETPAAADTVQTVLVKTATLGRRQFRDFLHVNGTLEAKDKATVSSRVAGTISQIHFDEGDEVKAGDVLFRLDDRTYRDNVAIARATLAAREAAVKVAEANLAKAKAELHKAGLDAARYKRLYDGGNASLNEYETYRLNQERAQAALDYAQSSLSSETAQVALAKATLAIREKDLEDTVIRAPLGGMIASRLHDPGEEIGAQSGVFTIVAPAVIRATMSLPAHYYSMIAVGRTAIRLTVSGRKYPHEVKVTSKSPVIETGLRTFEIKAEFDNADRDLLVPGAMLDADIELAASNGFAVPLDVPIKRDSGLLLFTVEDGKAHALGVAKGIEEDGWVEITGAPLHEGLVYISDGQYQVEEGTPLKTAGGK